MIISDLNHLEAVSQTVEITGGFSLVDLFSGIQGFTITSLAETSQVIGNQTVNSTAGTFTTASGANVAFATSSSLPTLP